MQQDRLQDTTPHDARPQCAECKTQDDRAQDVGRKLDGRRMDVERKLDGRRTKVGRTSNGSWMDVERKLDGRRRKVGRKLDGHGTDVERTSDASWTDVGRAKFSRRCYDGRWRHCTATPGNATLRRGRQSVTTRCYGEAGKALQLAAMARPAAGCSSLLR